MTQANLITAASQLVEGEDYQLELTQVYGDHIFALQGGAGDSFRFTYRGLDDDGDLTMEVDEGDEEPRVQFGPATDAEEWDEMGFQIRKIDDDEE